MARSATDFLNDQTFGVWLLNEYEAAFNGGGSFDMTAASDPDHPGVARFVATAAASRVNVMFRQVFGPSNPVPVVFGPGQTHKLVFRTPGAFVDGTDFFQYFGAMNFFDPSAGADPTDGYALRMRGSGDVDGICVDGGSLSATATLATLAVETWYQLRIETTATPSVVFSVLDMAGTVLGSAALTTDIPSARVSFGVLAGIGANSGAWVGSWYDALEYMAQLARGG